MRRSVLASAASAFLALAVPACAQEPAPPAAEAPADAAPESPRKPRPKPRPKPQAKPAEPMQAPAQDTPIRGSFHEAAETPQPVPAPPSATPFAAPPVACEPGQAVRYEAAKGLELWVTRSGTITIDNPLRPLTPDVTRVLQVVIGGRVATAYGPDTLSLRRGGSPVVLEGTVGGTTRWDATLATLPDALPILSDSGEPLAEFRFRACGTPPAAKVPPAPRARRTAPPPEATGGGEASTPETAKSGSGRPIRRAEPRPDGAGPKPPAANLPQGAIP